MTAFYLQHPTLRSTDQRVHVQSVPTHPDEQRAIAYVSPNMEVASPGLNGHVPSPDPDGAFDADIIVQHLTDLVGVTLGASTEDLQCPGSILSSSKRHDTVQRCARFALEPQVALYVQKTLANTQQINGNHHVEGE